MDNYKDTSNPGGSISPESASAPAAQDAVGFLRRRRWLFVFVALPIILGAVALAFHLPSIYQSEAKVLIEKPAIPEDIVASTITTYVDERIQSVSQRVLAADNLSRLIEEFGLYPELNVGGVSQTAIQTFRLDSELQNIAAEIFDARRGRMDGSTFAFVVGYRHSDPLIAQQVTSRLVQLYLDENVKSRTESSAETTRFLEQQAERVAGEISEIERKIADFKAEYAGSLPERALLNLQLADRTERELVDVEDEIRQLTSERDILQYELQTTSPYATMSADGAAPVMGAKDRLELLQLEYMRLTSTYGPEHPDVVRTKREIDAILGGDSAQSAEDLSLRIADLRRERDQMRDRYSNEHPDVQRLDRSIALLESQHDVIARQPGNTSISMPQPNNPEYIQKKLQLDGINARLVAARNDRSILLNRRSETEANIAIGPRVEKEWLELNRGYASSQEEYDEINMRISGAKMSESIESQNKGERFMLLEGASLPSDPIEPNRFAMIFLGAVLAIGGGIGMAALVDGLDSTVRSSRDLEIICGGSPLIAIPFIETASDRRARWVRQSLLTAIFVFATAAVILSI